MTNDSQKQHDAQIKSRVVKPDLAQRALLRSAPRRSFYRTPLKPMVSRLIHPVVIDGEVVEVLKRSRAEKATPPRKRRDKSWNAGAYAAPKAVPTPPPPAPPSAADQAASAALLRYVVALRARRRDPETDARERIDETARGKGGGDYVPARLTQNLARTMSMVTRGRKVNTGKRGWTDEGKSSPVPIITDAPARRGRPSKRDSRPPVYGDSPEQIAARERVRARREQAERLAERRASAAPRPDNVTERQYTALYLTEIEMLSLAEAGQRMGGITKVAVKHLIDKAKRGGLTVSG